MSEQLTLTPDELLTTTRAVRKRLDFTRPVEPGEVRYDVYAVRYGIRIGPSFFKDARSQRVLLSSTADL